MEKSSKKSSSTRCQRRKLRSIDLGWTKYLTTNRIAYLRRSPMKWFIALSLILYAVAGPLQQVQADNSKAPDFGPLASLVGEWQGKDPEGKPMTASYQWTGGGRSVVETIRRTEKRVMMTMYHADKGSLMLTHYCKLGNQPRMRATMPESAAK